MTIELYTLQERNTNADGLSRRPNEKPEWQPEEKELRGTIPQNQALNIALGDAENDIRRQNDHVPKNEEVVRHVRLQVPHPPSEVAGANMPQMAGVIPLTIRI